MILDGIRKWLSSDNDVRITVESESPAVADHEDDSFQSYRVAGTCSHPDETIRLWAREHVRDEEIIDVLCHEYMHHVLYTEVGKEVTEKLDNIVQDDLDKMLHKHDR